MIETLILAYFVQFTVNNPFMHLSCSEATQMRALIKKEKMNSAIEWRNCPGTESVCDIYVYEFTLWERLESMIKVALLTNCPRV